MTLLLRPMSEHSLTWQLVETHYSRGLTMQKSAKRSTIELVPLLWLLLPVLLFLMHLKSTSSLLKSLRLSQSQSLTILQQTSNSERALIRECIRLLSAKDPMALAQITEVGTAVLPDRADPSTVEQFMTEEQQAEAFAAANGMDVEDLRADESGYFEQARNF